MAMYNFDDGSPTRDLPFPLSMANWICVLAKMKSWSYEDRKRASMECLDIGSVQPIVSKIGLKDWVLSVYREMKSKGKLDC